MIDLHLQNTGATAPVFEFARFICNSPILPSRMPD